MNKRNTSQLISLILLLFVSYDQLAAQHVLTSPDGKISAIIYTDNGITFSVRLHNEPIVSQARIDLIFNNESLSRQGKFVTDKRAEVNDTIIPAIPLKERKINNHYNQLILDFDNRLMLDFRAFNDGVAYRFITEKEGVFQINEKADFEFPDDFHLWYSPIEGFMDSYEPVFHHTKLTGFPSEINSFLPVLLKHPSGYNLLLTDVDVSDYPHMFLQRGGENIISALFPPYPLETELVGDRESKITKNADYIALSSGDRTFPWRLMIITQEDAQLAETNLVYTLAGENVLEDTSWIRPGRVAWDWWNAMNIYGVDFESGINTRTYKYYIDFAYQYGLEYIILDEGWSVSTMDISRPTAEIDLTELIAYGKARNVGVILWTTWRALNENIGILDLYNQWGISGIKVDFMDRADQWMVQFYEKVAREAARNKLVVSFHGSFKPEGLHRRYPNVLTYEGVLGLEHNKWSEDVTPQHNLTLPFIRMVTGPMDYTPGAMRNFHPEEFSVNFARPGSQGTRSHQVAQFIIFESGLQMLADSPSNYLREKETTHFIAQIPNTWDEIKVLEAKIGEYLIMARRKDDTWYIAGMNNQTARDFTIELSFLGPGYVKALIMQDGINAHRFAEDYQLTEENVSNQSQLNITMAPNGGFAAIIKN